jgi:ABC-type polysaccharide/polyol phosphate export permease
MKAPTRRPSAYETVIGARTRVPAGRYLAESWQRRDLVRVLAGRELKSNYEMNIVGFAWWLLEPLSLTAVYYVFMEIVSGSGDATHEPNRILFILISLLSYKWLASSLIGAMGSVRANANLITDLYFPRALLPITEVAVGLAHYLVGLLVIPILMLALGVPTSWHLVFLPLVMLVQFIFTLGLSYPMSVWGLNYRNLPGLLSNILRLWFYLSPGIWALSRLEGHPWAQALVKWNPLTGLFESYRGAIFLQRAPGWELAWTAAVGLIAALVGGSYFIRREAQFGKEL